jgi:hypothetical protein
MRPLLFAVVLRSVGTSVPALTAESDDARMTADTLGSKTADSTKAELVSGRSAAAVGPAAPVVADGTPAPDSKGWWW